MPPPPSRSVWLAMLRQKQNTLRLTVIIILFICPHRAGTWGLYTASPLLSVRRLRSHLPSQQSFSMLSLVFPFSFSPLVPRLVLYCSHCLYPVSVRSQSFSIVSPSLHNTMVPCLLFSALLHSSHDPPSVSSKFSSSTTVGIHLAACHLPC